jgi:HAD superfamily hydrolase (TIGR01509 family)
MDAVLFDLDGTLIDTESVAILSATEAFAALGHSVTTDFLHSLVGVDQPTSRQRIQARFPTLDVPRLSQLWDAGFEARIAQHLPLKAGARDVLARLRVPLAIVTSSGRHHAHSKLALAQIDHHFAHVVTVNDVARPKPAPDPYLLAAQKLGLPPARCLVFEDSETGAEAAHRAGCTVVQVPDVAPATGRWAHHVAADLLAGARHFGLIT